MASLVAQMVKNPPAMQETWVQSMGWEDPLDFIPTPVFLPGESHGQRSLVGYSPWCHKESDTTETNTNRVMAKSLIVTPVTLKTPSLKGQINRNKELPGSQHPSKLS